MIIQFPGSVLVALGEGDLDVGPVIYCPDEDRSTTSLEELLLTDRGRVSTGHLRVLSATQINWAFVTEGSTETQRSFTTRFGNSPPNAKRFSRGDSSGPTLPRLMIPLSPTSRHSGTVTAERTHLKQDHEWVGNTRRRAFRSRRLAYVNHEAS